jgi:hypothetical protein
MTYQTCAYHLRVGQVQFCVTDWCSQSWRQFLCSILHVLIGNKGTNNSKATKRHSISYTVLTDHTDTGLTDHTDTLMLCTADRSYRQTAVMYCWQIIQTQCCYVLLTDHTDTVMLCTADRSYRHGDVMYCWQTIHTVLLSTADRSYTQCC